MQPRGNSASGFGQKVKEKKTEKHISSAFRTSSKMCWFSTESDFNYLCGLATASLSQPQKPYAGPFKSCPIPPKVLKEYLFTSLSNVQVLQRMCINHTVKGRGGKERGRSWRDDTLSWMSLFARWNAHKKVSKHYVALRMVNSINVLLQQCNVSWLSKFKALECLSSQRDNHDFPPRLQHPLEHCCDVVDDAEPQGRGRTLICLVGTDAWNHGFDGWRHWEVERQHLLIKLNGQALPTAMVVFA